MMVMVLQKNRERKEYICLLLMAAFVFSMLFSGQTEAAGRMKQYGLSTAAQLTKELDNMVNTREYYQVPGLGVIVYKNGKEVYSHFAGRAYIDKNNPANDRPITRDTRYRIASISKTFTVVTVMQLVEKGKLKLDADVSRYLGYTLRNPHFPRTPITLRMLLAHTSSIRDGGSDTYCIPPNLSLRECFEPRGKFWENGTHFSSEKEPPGVYFHYSNLNYVLMGAIIERVTGKRFDLYQKQNILKQLDTKADYIAANLRDEEFYNLAVLYRKRNEEGVWNVNGPWYVVRDEFNGRPARNSVESDNAFASMYGYRGKTRSVYSFENYKIGTNPSYIGPQGSLRVSLPELGNMLQMLGNRGRFRNRRILSEKSVQEIITPQWSYNEKKKNGNTYEGALLKYGLGIILIDGDKSARCCRKYKVDLIGHTGEACGLIAGAFFFADKPLDGFVFATNGEAVEEDEDPRCNGKFSGNYIWEEMIMDAIIRAMVEDK